jgi:hypothetical protein
MKERQKKERHVREEALVRHMRCAEQKKSATAHCNLRNVPPTSISCYNLQCVHKLANSLPLSQGMLILLCRSIGQVSGRSYTGGSFSPIFSGFLSLIIIPLLLHTHYRRLPTCTIVSTTQHIIISFDVHA